MNIIGNFCTANIARIPKTASGGWPDASNTGVPAGTVLTPFSGDFTTTSNGQTVDALDVSGTIQIFHSNVTVKRCRAFSISIGRGDAPVTAQNVLCEDCTVTGSGLAQQSGIGLEVDGTTGNADGAMVRRCNIFGVENGFDASSSNFTIRDCYLHDFGFIGADPHVDGLQGPGCSHVLIEHNNIEGAGPVVNSSCLTFGDAPGNNTDVLINNNRFHGGTELIYIKTGCTNFRVTNNLMITAGGGYVSDTTTPTQFYSGNYDQNGNPVSLP